MKGSSVGSCGRGLAGRYPDVNTASMKGSSVGSCGAGAFLDAIGDDDLPQ